MLLPCKKEWMHTAHLAADLSNHFLVSLYTKRSPNATSNAWKNRGP